MSRSLSAMLVTSLLTTMSLSCNAVTATVGSALPNPVIDAPLATTKGEQTAVLAGGCFWGIEAVFEHVKGVISASSGYSGGAAETAHYEMVSAGNTGHAESVRIKYDPSQISYGQLLKVFFAVAHDPTELNRQGPDTGSQYRSASSTEAPSSRKLPTPISLNSTKPKSSSGRSLPRWFHSRPSTKPKTITRTMPGSIRTNRTSPSTICPR